MNIEESPPWSKTQLRDIGEALLGRREQRKDCPDYNAVMLWHHELASEVGSIISSVRWANRPPANKQFAVTARSKTRDTLIQKLKRENWKLDRVQDVAGVRLDADINLTAQSRLAAEIADHFGHDRAKVVDLREQPHSGYRAVHVWLTFPAGRVEVQIRTICQSEWANAYEELADLVGRGIRYGQEPVDPAIGAIVERMHRISAQIAQDEAADDRFDTIMSTTLTHSFGTHNDGQRPDPALIDKAILALKESGVNQDSWARLRDTADNLRKLRRTLVEEGLGE